MSISHHDLLARRKGKTSLCSHQLDRHVVNGLGNMVQLWPCSRVGEAEDTGEFGTQVQTYVGEYLGGSNMVPTSIVVETRK